MRLRLLLASTAFVMPGALPAQVAISSRGPGAEQDVPPPEPLGQIVDRFAGAELRAPVIIDRPERPTLPHTIAPPDYRLMTLAGITAAGATLYLTWLLAGRPLGVESYDFAIYGPIPGTVLTPMVIHSVNGGRGNVVASVGASAAVWAGLILLLRAPFPVLPAAVQIPVAMLIETGTMGGAP